MRGYCVVLQHPRAQHSGRPRTRYNRQVTGPEFEFQESVALRGGQRDQLLNHVIQVPQVPHRFIIHKVEYPVVVVEPARNLGGEDMRQDNHLL
eukprot:CAMPEP_0114530982 /NCGR_PEP_ID=MMETSP0109-20121206/25768_1 /TAXON_ID=29199 /ORGANISM="Chlorarachnion reptans, Strain CCCM449" /LENGTH=92 /DNA_ID=CAMNT_0001713707 /DNA_START=82 /DNA_END=357 /DNA_ORIENTATION=+